MVAAAVASFGYDRYRVSRLADSVRHAFEGRRYQEAWEPLRRWLDRRPPSG
jgi:hypothetical protein